MDCPKKDIIKIEIISPSGSKKENTYFRSSYAGK